MMDAAAILARFSPFRESTPNRQRQMLSDVTTTTLPAGSTAFSRGSRCGPVALVGRGRIRVAKTDETGHEITLYHVGPGETCLLTLNCALTGDAYQADGAVEEDVEAVLIPIDRFRAWFDDDPRFRTFVITSITRRVTELMQLVEEVAFRDLRTRVTRFLQQAALREDDHCVAITHDALAVEVGASREGVSRILKDCERTGLLDLGRGRIRVIDPTGLLEQCCVVARDGLERIPPRLM
jgi:CRP/FNR family transcriptional regulator